MFYELVFDDLHRQKLIYFPTEFVLFEVEIGGTFRGRVFIFVGGEGSGRFRVVHDSFVLFEVLEMFEFVFVVEVIIY